jgi:hypothetical protein
MTKQSIILWVAGILLLAQGSGLLAQRGQGKIGGAGPGGGLPPVAARSSTTRDTVKAPPATSSHTTHTTGSSNLSASERLANNTTLSTRLQPLLPAGATVASASAGFQNQGEFVSALHVSRNLNIPFDSLKAKLVGQSPESLGQAVHDLRPDLSRSTVKRDVRLAERQADLDMDSARLASQLSANSTLAARAQALLPAGTNLQTAAAGFESEHQFLLAEHVSHDLNIPFDQLKAKVTGTDHVSLEQAVRALRPDLRSSTIKSDLTLARQETKTDLQAADQAAGGQREIADRH